MIFLNILPRDERRKREEDEDEEEVDGAIVVAQGIEWFCTIEKDEFQEDSREKRNRNKRKIEQLRI